MQVVAGLLLRNSLERAGSQASPLPHTEPGCLWLRACWLDPAFPSGHEAWRHASAHHRWWFGRLPSRCGHAGALQAVLSLPGCLTPPVSENPEAAGPTKVPRPAALPGLSPPASREIHAFHLCPARVSAKLLPPSFFLLPSSSPGINNLQLALDGTLSKGHELGVRTLRV